MPQMPPNRHLLEEPGCRELVAQVGALLGRRGRPVVRVRARPRCSPPAPRRRTGSPLRQEDVAVVDTTASAPPGRSNARRLRVAHVRGDPVERGEGDDGVEVRRRPAPTLEVGDDDLARETAGALRRAISARSAPSSTPMTAYPRRTRATSPCRSPGRSRAAIRPSGFPRARRGRRRSRRDTTAAPRRTAPRPCRRSRAALPVVILAHG